MAQERREVIEATIDAGESSTDVIDLTIRGRQLVAIQMPAEWTVADLAFEASADGVTYSRLWPMGEELLQTVEAAPDVFIVVPSRIFRSVRYLKITSYKAAGVDAVVVQAEDRTLKLVVMPAEWR